MKRAEFVPSTPRKKKHTHALPCSRIQILVVNIVFCVRVLEYSILHIICFTLYSVQYKLSLPLGSSIIKSFTIVAINNAALNPFFFLS